MNHSRFYPLVAVTALMFGAMGCTPSKDDKPPAPKVSGKAVPPGAGETIGTLPKLGAAPEWKLKDVEGNEVTFEQFKGKVVVVDFWATWCGPCRLEIPGYAEMTRKYGNSGLVIVGMSIDEGGPEVVKPFAAKMGINYQLVMADEAVQTAFGGISSIPTTFLIDRTGQVRDRKDHAEESDEYEKKVLAVLAEKVSS